MLTDLIVQAFVRDDFLGDFCKSIVRKDSGSLQHLESEKDSSSLPHLESEKDDGSLPHLEGEKDDGSLPHLKGEKDDGSLPHLEGEKDDGTLPHRVSIAMLELTLRCHIIFMTTALIAPQQSSGMTAAVLTRGNTIASGARWKTKEKKIITFPASYMTKTSKALYYFISARIPRSKNISEVTKDRALLNFTI
ncbi:hypothetical protein IEQ34_002899 [Dendrobium chrysotoxum]|uniref:Uncharacterized protein n=1 Tax=Dendrobium chrysotoxum TaxID=161865 RepID=A0AAV7HFR6_DENCH|nr:hypothetical protein IEQ34_002899 [Dendrobium chrysotoxum]